MKLTIHLHLDTSVVQAGATFTPPHTRTQIPTFPCVTHVCVLTHRPSIVPTHRHKCTHTLSQSCASQACLEMLVLCKESYCVQVTPQNLLIKNFLPTELCPQILGCYSFMQYLVRGPLPGN
jgi:hypothetical protein